MSVAGASGYRAPKSPAASDALPWPRGAPTLQPAEPAISLDGALGRHLELLGRALQQRELRGPPAAGVAQGDEAAVDCGAALRAAVEGDGRALLQSICSAAPGDCQTAATCPPPADDVSGWEGRLELPSASKHASCERDAANHKGGAESSDGRGVGASPRASKKGRAMGRRMSILSAKQRRMRQGGSQASVTNQSASSQSDDIVASLSSREKEGQSGLCTVVTSSYYFETTFAVLLILNALLMIIEEQYLGSKAGYDVSFYEWYGSDFYNARFMPGGDEVFNVLEYIFTSLFAVEAALRMAGRGRSYWKDPYELLDLFVVVCSVLSIISQNWDSMNVQIFRLLRTAKVLRMVKLIRRIRGLDSLHLMTAALSASGYVLLWASMLLFLMQSVVALILTNLLRDQYLLIENHLDAEQKGKLFEYFGTYARSMLSMFELTLANWPPICRFLTENLHEGWMVFAVAYKLSFGFAVVGVINAVFVQETFNVATADDSIMVKRKQRAASIHRAKMERLFKRADADGSGNIDVREFHKVLRDKSIQTWLESMDLDASNSDLIFELIKKDGSSTISINELIQGVARLKGAARSIDVQMVIRALKEQWAPESASPYHSNNNAMRDARLSMSNMSCKSAASGVSN